MRKVLWIVGVIFTVAVAAELALQVRSRWLQSERRNQSPLAQRTRAYTPFAVKHAHPQYLFFFPLDPAERIALKNDVCSLDAAGFREPGPAAAGGRRLAVMLGGSAAFGYYAASNDTTITSQLNRLQDRYFFINAAVPSWNSTQELIRLTVEIMSLHPALVIAFDGANDAVLTGQRRPGEAFIYPPGTPESFEDLEALMDEARSGSDFVIPELFPELRLRWRRLTGASDIDADEASPELIAAASDRYRENHQRMSDLARAAGAQFVSVFQPVANLHRHAVEWPRRPLLDAFHARASRETTYQREDFSAIFDREFEHIAKASAQLESDALLSTRCT